MIPSLQPVRRIAIACGGTGGHLFPGIAVAEALVRKGSKVLLLISPKEVDQQAIQQRKDLEILTLPAVGLTRGRWVAFVRGFGQSYRAAKRSFQIAPPHAALAMGGFTSAPPLLAAKRCGAQTFLHESNSIPGRANRWLSWIVAQAFVGFPAAATRLHSRNTVVTGTPVRAQIYVRDPGAARAALGLRPDRPVILVTGGSQGATAINELVKRSLPLLAASHPDWQWLHLTGSANGRGLIETYASLKLTAVVRPFLSEMDLALAAATAAISRAGASSLAELAAMRLPAILIPYPAAVDNHQFYNARAFEQSGAARLLRQHQVCPEDLSRELGELVSDSALRVQMQQTLGQWHAPHAAEQIAEAILEALPLEIQAESGAVANGRAVPDLTEGRSDRQGSQGRLPRLMASRRSETIA